MKIFSDQLAAFCAAGLTIVASAHATSDDTLLRNATAPIIKAECDRVIELAGRETSKLETARALRMSASDKFLAMNAISQPTAGLDGQVSIIAGVHPLKAVRDAAEKCSERLAADNVARQQRAKLYQFVKSIQPGDDVEKKLQQDWLYGFEDAGVALPPTQKARFKKVADDLTKLATEFDRNIREFKGTMTFTSDELKGLPDSFLKSAKKDKAGNYVVGFSYPEYEPIMALAESSEARARYSKAFAARGGQRNIDVLKKVLLLRKELATLIGQPNYSAMIVRRRMAETPQSVDKFLGEVRAAIEAPAQAEVAELRAENSARLGLPLDKTPLARTDYAFLQERIRKSRYAIDQEALRAYFPTEASLQWILDVSSSLYGIRFEELKEVYWHPDARLLQVTDQATGAVLGRIHLDLFPRDGKYNHAAVFPITMSSTVIKQLPRVALVTNFNRMGLDHGELETLVHEFGHALHGVLSQTRYIDQAGTSVERDFVEAPSQMFEEWARRFESLQRLKKFCAECPEVTPEMAQRLQQARQYGQALRYARQYEYAKYDLDLNVGKPTDPMTAWRDLENTMPWGYDANLFPSQFGHLMGYASAYYGYMWSEVMALDMLSAYGSNLMDGAVGMRYRQNILSRGSELPASQMVRNFLGRDPNTDAFFKEITGQRLQ